MKRYDAGCLTKTRDDLNSNIFRLTQLDWQFSCCDTLYASHGLHPYPAKFIPQIPQHLILELSSPGDIILDPFCGSGTTLVEALLLERNAIGIDANPLACLISKAKTVRLNSTSNAELQSLISSVESFLSHQHFMFMQNITSGQQLPVVDRISFWFEDFVIKELSILKNLCLKLNSPARLIALSTLSSIIVSVSKQDSDTRYVRRKKNLKPGATLRRFLGALRQSLKGALDFTSKAKPDSNVLVLEANILDSPQIETVDLVITSPPYPNAYSYHLYHMTRMLWLDLDPYKFKKQEIGSHRKYSHKGANGANINTFRQELDNIFCWLSTIIKQGGYACFVIGDSIINGKLFHNNEHLKEIAANRGFSLEAEIPRRLNNSRKSFNPRIGKIQIEHIVILRNDRGDT
jgi:site-specific DNA-methyltransferase (cytosine-N4-specific)